jgi:hypothetical protein
MNVKQRYHSDYRWRAKKCAAIGVPAINVNIEPKTSKSDTFTNTNNGTPVNDSEGDQQEQPDPKTVLRSIANEALSDQV